MSTSIRKEADKVPEPTLRRLPWYLSNIKLMKEKGEQYVSSTQISKEINIDASQIAKDLSYVNISGRTRVGYNIDALIEVLESFLGFTNMHKAFLFGVGCLPVRRSDARPFYLDCRKAVLPSCEAESDAGEVRDSGRIPEIARSMPVLAVCYRQFCIVLHYSRTKEPFQGATTDRKVAGDTGR